MQYLIMFVEYYSTTIKYYLYEVLVCKYSMCIYSTYSTATAYCISYLLSADCSSLKLEHN